jgi:hypothetical protein
MQHDGLASSSRMSRVPEGVRQREAQTLLNDIYAFLLDRRWRQRNQRLPWRDPHTGNDYEVGGALEIQMKRELLLVGRDAPHEAGQPTEAKP